MAKYVSRRERRSRLANQESKRMVKQTILIIIIIIALIFALIFFGIPALIKMAIFLGDLRSSTTPVEQQDTIPPATPQLSTPPNATSSSLLVLTGYSEPGATVKLFQNNSLEDESTVDSDGVFTFTKIRLKPGLNRFYILAFDSTGNESLRSSTHTVVLDNDAPPLNLSSPTGGQEFYGLNEQRLSLTGSTDPNVSLQVNDHFLVVNSDGSFTSAYQLSDGENTLKFVVTDNAGNSTQEEIKVIYHP